MSPRRLPWILALKWVGPVQDSIWRHISNHIGNYVEIYDLGIDKVTDIA